MASIKITLENFEETIERGGIVWVDWFADWCGPCKQFAPVFEAASEKHSEITFGKIETDAQQQLASNFRIRSIPTLMAFRDGIRVFSQSGALSAPELEKVIRAVNDLDMDSVRSEVAKRQVAPLN